MTQKFILEWLNVVWERQPGASLRNHTKLVLDNFCGHITETVTAKVNEDSDLVTIPTGSNHQQQVQLLLSFHDLLTCFITNYRLQQNSLHKFSQNSKTSSSTVTLQHMP
jgi:hypothetical protein